ncbi:hypothetical protein BH11PSE3_BH11PSE3_18950 [soil metagenome]
MDKPVDDNAARKELVKAEQMITETEAEIRGLSAAYAAVANPHDLIGSHRSIWSAPDEYREPFTEATKRLGELTAKRRALKSRVGS